MKKRTITGIIMALVLIPLIIFPKLFYLFYVLMGLGALIAADEMIRMFSKEKEISKGIKIIILIATIGIFALLTFSKVWLDSNETISDIARKFMIGIFLLLIASLSMLVFIEEFNGSDIGKVLTTVLYVALGTSSIILLRAFDIRFLIYLFLTVMLTDVFAYIFGVKFGKHKMTPKISPKKSWEGAIFGTLVATLVSGTLALFYGSIFKGILNPNNVETLIDGISNLSNLNFTGKAFIIYPLTILLSIVGQIGDLVASKFKRTYEIKDFGNIFPGHGGILDRFDSSNFGAMFLITIMLIVLA